MTCPDCGSVRANRRRRRTVLAHQTFACRACRRVFNERTGTPFNELQCPTDIVLLAVLWRLRYKLSFRDAAELLLLRGFEVTHERSARESSASRPCWRTNSAANIAGMPTSLGTSTRPT